jgi:hypothetical protein
VKFRCSTDEGGTRSIWIEKYSIYLIEGTLFMRKTNSDP